MKVYWLFSVVHIFEINILGAAVGAVCLRFLFAWNVYVGAFFAGMLLLSAGIHTILHTADKAAQQPWSNPSPHDVRKKVQTANDYQYRR